MPRQIACTSVVFPVPSSPESPMTAGADRVRPSSSPNRLSSSARRRIPHPVPFRLELQDLVAQQCGELEIELLGGSLHLLLQQPNQRLPLVGVGRAAEDRKSVV